MPTTPTEEMDLLSALRHAQSDGCRLFIARRIVDAREAAGLYSSVIQGKLTADLREILAREILKESERADSV